MKTPHRLKLTHASKPSPSKSRRSTSAAKPCRRRSRASIRSTLYIDKREIVTLMTLGQRPRRSPSATCATSAWSNPSTKSRPCTVDWETASVAITTRAPLEGLEKKMEKRTVTTGCGQGTVFGDLMEDVDSIKLREDVTLTEDALHALLDAVRRHEAIYKEGGRRSRLLPGEQHGGRGRDPLLHRGRRQAQRRGRDRRTDVARRRGRLGQDLLHHGRLTSEMVIKAAQMRIPSSFPARASPRWATRSANKVGSP